MPYTRVYYKKPRNEMYPIKLVPNCRRPCRLLLAGGVIARTYTLFKFTLRPDNLRFVFLNSTHIGQLHLQVRTLQEATDATVFATLVLRI